MAIDRMTKLTVLFSTQEGERFEEWLYSRAALHLVSLEHEFTKLSAAAIPLSIDEQDAAEKLSMAEALLVEADSLAKEKKNFIDSMLPMKTVVREGDLREALTTVPLEELHAQVARKSRGVRDCYARLSLLARERQHLAHFSFLTVPVTEMKKLARTFCFVAEGSPARMENVSRDREADGLMAWEMRRRQGDLLTVVFAGRKKDAAKCADIVRAHGFHILDYPDLPVGVMDRIEQIDREEEETRAERDALQEELKTLLAPTTVRNLCCLRGHWESEKKRAEKARAMLCSKRVGVARGYVRAADAAGFIADLEKEFPGASVVAADPVQGDAVPVSIRLPRWLRPFQLLITMFGLPDYFSIDPTPYLAVVFLVFFGICFADVVYGLLLMLFSWLMIRRYRFQDNLREFFRLFYYCGISTVIFGVLTGSWAADIYNYFGPSNVFQRFVQKTTVLDMLAKPVIALMIALAIGVANQFYGIVMRMVKDIRQSNWKGAVYDGAFWLIYLGGLLAAAITGISGRGGSIARGVSLVAVAGGAVGLVLTQGRDEKSIAGKAIFGVVSLYGIVGGYGTVSFIGDVLSYSRLLALGLTTYIVGMSFNIIANLVPQIILSLFPFLKGVISCPVVGGALIAGVMVFGHLFNFFLSILSAFVHSARLILLEWFGRFYQGGGEWFQPHGFTSDTVELVNE
jgi:V/A-type H+/Na+-transporting ATPase subunit I